MSENNFEDIAAMNFEQSLQELEQIVDGLEKGNVPLDQSIAQYDRGQALRRHCVKLLEAAEAKVEKIKIGNGSKAIGSEPLDEG